MYVLKATCADSSNQVTIEANTTKYSEAPHFAARHVSCTTLDPLSCLAKSPKSANPASASTSNAGLHFLAPV